MAYLNHSRFPLKKHAGTDILYIHTQYPAQTKGLQAYSECTQSNQQAHTVLKNTHSQTYSTHKPYGEHLESWVHAPTRQYISNLDTITETAQAQQWPSHEEGCWVKSSLFWVHL